MMKKTIFYIPSVLLALLLFVGGPLFAQTSNCAFDFFFDQSNTTSTSNSVILDATVFVGDSNTPTPNTRDFLVQWGEDSQGQTSYTGSDTVTVTFDQSTGEAPFNYTISGLEPQTTYAYRIVDAASNEECESANLGTTAATSSQGGSSGSSGSGGTTPPSGSGGSGGTTPPAGESGATSPEFSDLSRLQNPLDVDSVDGLLEKILDAAMTIAIPIVALFIIYAGFLFVTARGNPEKLKKAKETLIYTLIGAAILLGAWTIVNIISGTFEALQD